MVPLGYTDDVSTGKSLNICSALMNSYYASSYLEKHVFKAVEDEIKPAAGATNFPAQACIFTSFREQMFVLGRPNRIALEQPLSREKDQSGQVEAA